MFVKTYDIRTNTPQWHCRLWNFCADLCAGRSGDWKAETAFKWVSTTSSRCQTYSIDLYGLSPAPNFFCVNSPPIMVTMALSHSPYQVKLPANVTLTSRSASPDSSLWFLKSTLLILVNPGTT